jgi:hypothetical protein
VRGGKEIRKITSVDPAPGFVPAQSWLPAQGTSARAWMAWHCGGGRGGGGAEQKGGVCVVGGNTHREVGGYIRGREEVLEVGV